MSDRLTSTTTNSSPTSSSNMPTPRQFTCVGCRGPIRDQYVFRVAPDMEWHANCLRCSDCRQQLDETCTCFVRDGHVYCKPDYIRLFGTKCAKCNESFGRNDLVMKAKSNVYHVTCFRCTVCCRQLVSGDEFSLREDAQLLCKTDHEAAYNNNNIPGSSIGLPCDDPCGDDVIVTASSADDAKHGGSDTSSSRSGAASPDLLRDGSPDLDFVVGVASSTASSGGDCGPQHRQGDRAAPNGGGNFHRIHHGGRMIGRNHHHHHRGQDPHHKTTRIRTVLNEKQLHMLRTCYSANSRPDALMKEQLVEMTGLSPRVIRVWFQNKRCKDKKRSIALKQLQQQQQNKVDGCHLEGSWIHKGVPLIATSPVRHEPSVNFIPTPVEVHKFPGVPWSMDLAAQHQQHAGRDSPGTADLEALAPGSPDPLSPACDLTRPGSNQILRGLAAVHQCVNGTDNLLLHAGSSLVQSQSLAGESFDDDTVVSFDDLSDVMSCGGTSQGVPAGCPINQLTNGATIRPPTDGVSGSRSRNDENTPILLQQQQANTYGSLDGISF